MKIGIDISQIIYEGTGVSRFNEGLLDAILQYDTENKWVFFFSSFRRKMKEKLLQKIYTRKQSFVQWKLPPTALSFLWNDLHIFPPHFNGKLDWFITSDWTEPPKNTKKATIVHDLVFKKYPETVHPKILSTQQKRLQWVSKESDIIFADSKSTVSDLEKYYSVNPGRIALNYPGLTVTHRDLDKNEIPAILEKYKITPPFILTVGKIEPRKNIERLIKAYNSLLAEQNIPELVIAGMEGWDSNIEENENIKYIGFVSDKELAALYKSAMCFVMPSIYEGFGYPVLEAMAYGCPVATSNTSSLAELAENNAALTFDPFNTEAIADSIQSLVTNHALRQELRTKGLEKSEEFTWKRYMDTLLTTLKKGL